MLLEAVEVGELERRAIRGLETFLGGVARPTLGRQGHRADRLEVLDAGVPPFWAIVEDAGEWRCRGRHRGRSSRRGNGGLGHRRASRGGAASRERCGRSGERRTLVAVVVLEHQLCLPAVVARGAGTLSPRRGSVRGARVGEVLPGH